MGSLRERTGRLTTTGQAGPRPSKFVEISSEGKLGCTRQHCRMTITRVSETNYNLVIELTKSDHLRFGKWKMQELHRRCLPFGGVAINIVLSPSKNHVLSKPQGHRLLGAAKRGEQTRASRWIVDLKH